MKNMQIRSVDRAMAHCGRSSIRQGMADCGRRRSKSRRRRRRRSRDERLVTARPYPRRILGETYNKDSNPERSNGLLTALTRR